MSEELLSLTLRECRAHFSEPLTWGLMGVVGAVVGIAGPFGTYSDFSPPESVAYWCVVVLSTYAVGLLLVLLVINWGRSRGWPTAASALVGGLIAGLPVTLVVLAINTLVYDTAHADRMSPQALLGYCTAIALGVSTAFALVQSKQARTENRNAAAPGLKAQPEEDASFAARELPRILQRLPHQQRGRLLALSVQDHYTEVVTDRGKPLVLIRLGDAIKETDGVDGLQIHRSHWIALQAVRKTLNNKGRIEIELENGDVLPVSRSYAPLVRKAGLIS